MSRNGRGDRRTERLEAQGSDDRILVGKITTVYGVKGWLKVHSYTSPIENILDYDGWYLAGPNGANGYEVDVVQGRKHNNTLVVHLRGVDDRDVARKHTQKDIYVTEATLPSLEDGEYYWHQLQGLNVFHCEDSGSGMERTLIGVVDHLLETGANDVLVVRTEAGAGKSEQKLIPYVAESVVLEVDLEHGEIWVDWPYDD